MASTHSHSVSLDEKFQFTSKAKTKLIMLIVTGLVMFGIGLGYAFYQENHKGDHGHGAAKEQVKAGEAKEEAAAPKAEGEVKEGEQAKAPVAAAEGEAVEKKEEAAEHGEAHHGPSPVWKRVIKNLWHNNVFFAGIALVGVFFIAFNYVATAGWSAAIKRVPEAFGNYLPVAALITVGLLAAFGSTIFHWIHAMHNGALDDKSPEYDAVLASKTWYLNDGFFWGRTIAYFVLWILFWMMLRKKSKLEDLNGGTSYYYSSIVWSAGFLVIFGVTSSTAAWDWVMSTDPHFFSTMFGWYTFASWFVSGLAVITLIVIMLKENGYLSIVNENHLHDLGKFMFAFSIFWTYVWFEQFMLIFYSNIPEEARYFADRYKTGPYMAPFFVAFIINFIFPFLALMTRNAKRQMIMLKIVAVAIIIGHWVDFYVMLTPPILGMDGGWDFATLFLEVGMAFVFIGVFAFVILNGLTKANLVAKNHPMLEESIHHHVY